MKIFITIIILFASQSIFSQINDSKNLFDSGKKKNIANDLSNMVSIEYVYTRNLGNFGDVYKDANGVMLSYGRYYPSSYLVVLRTGFQSHRVRTATDTVNSDFKVVPLHIGGRYYFRKKFLMPYFSFMNGINIVSQNRDLEGNSDKRTLIRYAMQVGFGCDVKIAKQFGINININYNNEFYRTDAMMTGFEYGIGVSYSLKNGIP